jgi:hypothetical protein
MGTWDLESAGEQFLEVAGGNEILIFRMLSNKTGDERTKRDDPEVMDARELQRSARKFAGQPVAFKWRRNFGVHKNNAAWGTSVVDKGAKTADAGFEALSFFVVGDGYLVEIHVHDSPCGFADFFIPDITERAGWALVDLPDDAIAPGAVHVDPRPSADVENFA